VYFSLPPMTATLPNWPVMHVSYLCTHNGHGKVCVHEPLWNFSSMGGTIWRTFLNISLEAGDIVGLSDMAWMYVKGGGEYGIQGV